MPSRRSPARPLLAVAPFVLGWMLVGCSDPFSADGTDVRLSTDRERYAVEDEAVLTLSNPGREEIEFVHGAPDLCGWAMIERRVDDGWANRGMVEPVCVSVMQIRRLRPGESVENVFPITSRKFEADERYRMTVAYRGSDRDTRFATSDPFVVH